MTATSERLAARSQRMKASAIREILKVTQNPEILSLAGGLPAPEAFPVEIIRTLCNRVLDDDPVAALQYGPSEGHGPLREALVEYSRRQGMDTKLNEVLIFSGSQQVIDLLGKVLLDPGDNVVVENPTYLGALQAMNAYQPNYIPWPTDEDGAIPEALEGILRDNRVKLVYLVPNFQNPSGRTLSLERRQAIASILERHGVFLLEDDPYGRLRFEGTAIPPIKTFTPEHVIYQSTFSKLLSPGFRIGWAIAPESIAQWLVIAKQGADLHTNTFTQAVATEFLIGGYMENHLPVILDIYSRRLKALLDAMETHLSGCAHWTRPQGGMFTWVTLADNADTDAIYWKAIEAKVAFVPGKYFFADGTGSNTMRLNFSNTSEDGLREAVRRLATVINE